MNQIIFMFIKLFNEHLCPVDEDIIILDKTSPFSILSGINLITQENFVLIACDPLSKVASGPEPCQENIACIESISYVALLSYCPLMCHLSVTKTPLCLIGNCLKWLFAYVSLYDLIVAENRQKLLR